MPDPHAARSLEPVERILPYAERLDCRNAEQIRRIVLHCTELPDLATARSYGERVVYASGTGNSGHYYVDRDGHVERWIPDLRIAHHVRDHNADSIGIELVNAGRWPDWYDSRRQHPGEPYPEAQIESLIRLIIALRSRYPQIAGLAGHEDLDLGTVAASDDPRREVRRKIDPGPQFPWLRVLHSVALPRLNL